MQDLFILTYAELIHDFGIATFQDWKELSYHNLHNLQASATVSGRPDIAEMIKKITARHNSHESFSEHLRFYIPIADFMSGKHIDDYFATIPQDIMNIICDMLQTTTETLVPTYMSDRVHTYKRCTYFCGVPHSLPNKCGMPPLFDAPARIEWNLRGQFEYKWYKYGIKQPLYSIRGTLGGYIVITTIDKTNNEQIMPKHGCIMHYYEKNEFKSSPDLPYYNEYHRAAEFVEKLMSRALLDIKILQKI